MSDELPVAPTLPGLILLQDYDGTWDRYVEAIYSCFKTDFVDTKPAFRGRRLGLKRHPVIQNKEATFWHFVSEGDEEADRLPEIRRCERIRWPRAIIEQADALRAKVWTEVRGSEKRIHIWYEQAAYLVVLADRGDYVLPWTAYPVERQRQREKLNSRYETYRPKKAGPAI